MRQPAFLYPNNHQLENKYDERKDFTYNSNEHNTILKDYSILIKITILTKSINNISLLKSNYRIVLVTGLANFKVYMGKYICKIT